MALDKNALKTPGSPEWWMQMLARQLLDPVRLKRLATLQAYRAGCPPLPYLAPSQRAGFYDFMRVARLNLARKIVNSRVQRMAIRTIRTAAADDDNGDQVAWRYFTGSGLDLAATDVHSDMQTFAEGYVRVGVDAQDKPIALRCDPWSTVIVTDPLNPNITRAAFMLLWDELAGRDYAYLWLPGEEYVADAERATRPKMYRLAGSTVADRPWLKHRWLPRMSFDPQAFTMRPKVDDVPADERDSGPYSQSYEMPVVPVVQFPTRDAVGIFEEHLDALDRINHSICQRVVIAAVQAFKQRALKQEIGQNGAAVDRLPDTNPETGEDINWDEIFQPGPDALWKLPPGVSIQELTEAQLDPIRNASTDDIKHVSSGTDTPLPLMSDDTNSSAEAAQARREGLVFSVEDSDRIAGRRWADVISLMFLFAPERDRYTQIGDTRVDRADAGQIIIDWMPAERYSLSEKSQADSQNKTLSTDMAAAKIWQLTPDEVAINRAQRAADALLNPTPVASAPTG